MLGLCMQDEPTVSKETSTSDLCDRHEDLLEAGELQIIQGTWQWFGARRSFEGPVRLLQVFEDNSLVADALRGAGEGAVLVVDGGGSLRRALIGGNLAQAAQLNGWAGALVYGAVRDTREIDAAAIGVCALGACPRRSIKRGQGQRDGAVSFGGVTIRPGAWIYADADGILVSSRRLGGS
jgi:regulator of ribonuclease activity A